jgi:uncharacterized DUF497 family protein
MIEFDPDKARLNRLKHGIDFTDLEPVFFDPRAFTTDRPWPTPRGAELRHITTGTDALGRVVTVVWTQRGTNLRLISARHPREDERRHYEKAG